VTKKEIKKGARSLPGFSWNKLYQNKKNPRSSTTPIYTLLTRKSVQENTKINVSLLNIKSQFEN
jgi:hypothetical protein